MRFFAPLIVTAMARNADQGWLIPGLIDSFGIGPRWPGLVVVPMRQDDLNTEPIDSKALPPSETRIFVVKVASRCNLACSYCYMYYHPDQSWRHQPRFMSRAIVRNVAFRLEQHAQTLRSGSLAVVVHGGEPLLYPDLEYFFSELESAVKSCRLALAIQTNGTLFDDNNLAIIEKHRVHVGISIDGSRDAHNRVRINHSGIGSYDDVLNGLRLVQAKAPHLLDSVLQVIDIGVPPKEMLDTLESYGVGRADLLLPDLNHDTIAQTGLSPGDIGDWLIRVFDQWVKRGRTVYIRIFITIIDLLLGGRWGTELFGTRSAGALMIETDGSYEIHDGLKTAFQGAGHTGMNVAHTPVAVVEALPMAMSFREKARAASRECLECHLFSVCGGGSPLHRYSQARGFDRPSAYCLDLMILIEHIAEYLTTVRPGLRLAI